MQTPETLPWSPEARFDRRHDIIQQHVIYDKARDFPGKFVVREWTVTGEGMNPGKGYVCDTLKQARDLIPADGYRLPRFAADDPAILEVYL